MTLLQIFAGVFWLAVIVVGSVLITLAILAAAWVTVMWAYYWLLPYVTPPKEPRR